MARTPRNKHFIDRLTYKLFRKTAQYQLVRRIFRENFKKHRWKYLFGFLLMILGSYATAYIAWLMKDLVNTAIEADSAEKMTQVGLNVIIVFLVSGLSTYGYLVLVALARNDMSASLRVKVYQHLLKLRVEYFDSTTLGEIFIRANSGVSAVSGIIENIVLSVGRDLLTLIFLVCVMVIQAPVISLVILIVGPVAGVLLRSITRKTRMHSRAQLKDQAVSQSLLKEMITGITMVKTFSLEQEMSHRMGNVVEGLRQRNDRISKLSARTSPIMEMIGGIVVGLLIINFGWWLTQNEAEGIQPGRPGEMMSFITAFLLAYKPAKNLANLRVMLERLYANANFMYELVDHQKPENILFSGNEKITTTKGEVEIENVQFNYSEDIPVLRDVSLSGSTGEKIGLVGPSGSGKSTIFKLILALYKPHSGHVRIDGKDVFEATPECVRGLVSYVGQESFIYSGTIAENIRFGRLDASDEDVRKAAEMANATEFIDRLPDGYDTFVGDNGTQLSGGQRQRIAIARAFLKDAPIVLLDEATSALDTESEQAIQSALDNLVEGKTTFIIAHRLSTIQKCDRIYVVANGEIVEQGDHKKLLKDDKIYAQLYRLQVAG